MEKNKQIFLYVLAIALLVSIAQYNYLFFHSTVEGLSVLVSTMTFVVAATTHSIAKNSFFLFLGIAYLFVGSVDFLHLLTYKGMNIFPQFDANAPTQLWVVGRYLEAITLALAPTFCRQTFSGKQIFALFAVLTTCLTISILIFPVFPTCYIDGVGLTSFKIISEYVICTILLIGFFRLSRLQKLLPNFFCASLKLSIIFSILAELCFTSYLGVYDGFNLSGHILKLISYTLIFVGIIIEGLRKPFQLVSEELASEREDARNRFIRIWIHELRNPLTTIKAVCELLNLQTKVVIPHPQLEDRIHTIESEVEHLDSLLAKVLDALKSQEGNLPIRRKAMELSALVSQVTEAHQVSTDKVAIVCQSLEEAWIEGDPSRLNEVMHNLLNNAIKYSPKGSTVTVALNRTADSVIVNVADQGLGIPKDQLSRVFDGFYRATNLPENDPGGMGLGLYICQYIIKHHDGQIWVESVEGEGTTFYFKLPILNSGFGVKG